MPLKISYISSFLFFIVFITILTLSTVRSIFSKYLRSTKLAIIKVRIFNINLYIISGMA